MTKAKILVVEDDAVVRRFIELHLENIGHEVIGVTDRADEAIIKVESLLPDLVLMDIELKGQEDGLTAARKIQEGRRIPVIFVTSRSDDQTLDRARITDPYGYLVKPIKERELAITIELSLSRHRAEQERERLILELQEALATVKKLSGLLPICSYCKKIRDKAGKWNRVEDYLYKNSEAVLTHGACPTCMDAALHSLE